MRRIGSEGYMVDGKNIVLGITGGIAAYKAAELTRELVKRGCAVTVMMTLNAAKFITPLTLQTLSGNPVYTDTFSLTGDWRIGHISLAERADIIVIAPATANIIGKIASGIADDLLSTTVMAAHVPVLICPAMNANMYRNPFVAENMKRCTDRGFFMMDADIGELACRTEGPGRLPPVGEIIEEMEAVITVKDLSGVRILVTAGPTREAIDPVRFISNHSSGKMGHALAKAARMRGAEVTLICGATAQAAPGGVRYVKVTSAQEMRDAVMATLDAVDVVIKAAAVADYRPSKHETSKIKKKDETLTITLVRNPDIIAEVGKVKGSRILVGFAMETEDLEKNAREKMMAKNMDFIVANDLTQEGAGFQHDTNVVKILDRNGAIEELPLMEKSAVAHRILDRVRDIRNG